MMGQGGEVSGSWCARAEKGVSCEERRERIADGRVGEGWASETIGVMRSQQMRVLLELCSTGDGGRSKHTH